MNEIPDSLPEDFDDEVNEPAVPGWSPDKDNLKDELDEAMLEHLKGIKEAGGVKAILGAAAQVAMPDHLQRPNPSSAQMVEHMRQAWDMVKGIFPDNHLDSSIAFQCYQGLYYRIQEEWSEQESKKDQKPTPEAEPGE